MKNLDFNDKFYMIFDYSKIIKLLFKIYLKFNSKMYNYLFNFNFNYLFSIDLKYVYLTILFHLENRYYFVFIILKINQIQSKRI